MKAFTLLIIVSTAVEICQSQSGFIIKGDIRGLDTGKIYLIRSTPSEPIDSSEIIDGKFSFRGIIKEPCLVELFSLQIDYVHLFYLEDAKFKIKMDLNPFSCDIVGGTLNEQYKKHRKETEHLYDSIWHLRDELSRLDSLAYAKKKPEYDVKIAAHQSIIDKNIAEFIAANPDSYITPGRVLTLYYKNYKTLEKEYALLSDRIQKSREGLNIVDRINELKNSPVVGGKAKGFTLADPDSKRYSIQKLNKGKYLLIDFWASWCGPCIEEFPYLRQAYERFQKQGFQIVGISIDKDRTAWIKSLSTHKLAWLQLLDEKVKGTSVQGKYSVRSIPSNFLIDNEMKIVAINLRGEKLLKTLEELLKEE